MPVSARIKITQGMSSPPAGESLIGVLTTPVTFTNDDDSGVATWEWTMIDVPPTSAVPSGVVAVGSVPTHQIIPDQRGGYHVKLRVIGLDGSSAEDFRVFQVPEPSGHVIPPFDAVGPALNFGGQLRGWAKYLEEVIRFVLGGVVTPANPPRVYSVTPDSGDETGGTAITITGEGFVNGAGLAVSFDGTPATSVVWVSSTSITCNTPAKLPGPHTVRVTNPDGQSGELLAGFTHTFAISVAGSFGAWKLDEQSGVLAAPSAGAIAGTHGPNVTHVAGKIGNAVHYNNGLSRGFTDFGEVMAFERTTAFSVSFWVRYGVGQDGVVICKRETDNTRRRGWSIRVNNVGQATVILTTDWATSSAVTKDTAGQSLNNNSWHHVVVTYSGSSNAAGVLIYVDGALSADATGFNALAATILNAGHFMFGRHGHSGDLSSFVPFGGDLDDVAVFLEVLSAADVLKIYNEGNAGASAAYAV